MTTAEEVDRGRYGKFSNDAPFNTPIRFPFPITDSPRPLPGTVGEMGTVFHLYTRRNRLAETNIDDSDIIRLRTSNYDGNAKTFFIIHGWTGKSVVFSHKINVQLKKGFLKIFLRFFVSKTTIIPYFM